MSQTKATSPIGRHATILARGKRYWATVIDAKGREPKRVRIQSAGSDQGKVLMPGEYNVIEYL